MLEIHALQLNGCAFVQRVYATPTPARAGVGSPAPSRGGRRTDPKTRGIRRTDQALLMLRRPPTAVSREARHVAIAHKQEGRWDEVMALYALGDKTRPSIRPLSYIPKP